MLYCSLLDRAKKINDACLYMQIENQCKELRKELKLRVFKIQFRDYGFVEKQSKKNNWAIII